MNFAKHGYFEVIEWNYEKSKKVISMCFDMSFLFGRIFATWQQKKVGESNKGIFEFLKKNCYILTKNI
jgi:hypothetical protein